MVTVPVLTVAFAAKLSTRLALRVKSAATADAFAAAATVTVYGSGDATDAVAVTVLTPLFSEMEAGSSFSVSVGRGPEPTRHTGT